MTPWLRRLHKWLGLLIGLQFILWMASGVVMSLLDAHLVQGKQWRAAAPVAAAWPAGMVTPDVVLARAGGPVQNLASGWLGHRPVYRLTRETGPQLIDAREGLPLVIDAGLALAQARASYTGNGVAAAPVRLERSMETRAHPGAVWRVDFNDADDTSVYVSAQSGQVLEHRNRTWRLFDFFWMLHIMDYTGRQDFNNPLVVGSAIGGLTLALAGIWLLGASFRWDEFVPERWRGRRRLALYASDGTCLRTVPTSAGVTVYEALARQGLPLPSNCGGGQSCGLCEVRVLDSAPPPTSADRSHLGETKIARGCRLACNLVMKNDMAVEVAEAARLANERSATVMAVRAVTPFLREVVLRPVDLDETAYRPGAYIQIHVPTYTVAAQGLGVDSEHHADWSALTLPATLANAAPVRRAYSLSAPVRQVDGQLTLLVRFMAPPAGSAAGPGIGSTYVYQLQPGATIRFSGPFGDFALKQGSAEKVFIGAGAGMAPLRAMIRTLLADGAREPIHFWYGARSLRDVPYADEMAELARRHANFQWRLVLSQEATPGNAAPPAYVHQAVCDGLLRGHPALTACDFYLCGPPPMLAATLEMLAQQGVCDEQIAYDDFKI